MRVSALVLLFAVVSSHGYGREPEAVPQSGTVVIQTANPYTINVDLEVKCDWEWRKGKYLFHKFITVPGKRKVLINVPNNLKFCEIWPKISIW